MDCETFEYVDSTVTILNIIGGFCGMYIANIINWIYSFIKPEDTSIEPVNSDGAILLNQPRRGDLVDPWKVFYQVVFSSFGIRLILFIMSWTTNNHCKETERLNELNMSFLLVAIFIFVGGYAYFNYFFIQLTSICYHIESDSWKKTTTNCKSVIAMLMMENPALVFTCTDYEFLAANTLYDKKVTKERFIYQRCEDITDPKQLKRLEEQLNTDNPVLLNVKFSIFCGDTETRLKYLDKLESFVGPPRQMHPMCPRVIRVKIDPYDHDTEMLLWWDTERDAPWWMSEKWFWVFTVLFLGAPYKFFFDIKTQRVTVDIKKVIYCK